MSERLPVTRGAQRARLAVVGLFLTNGMMIGSFVARIPVLKGSLGLSKGELGIALLGLPIGTLIALLAGGAVIARVGARPVTTAGLVTGCAGLALIPLAGNRWGLMAALMVAGAGIGAMDVGANAQAIVVEGLYGRSVMSGFHGWWSVGSLTGAAIGGLVIGADIATGPHLSVAALLLLVVAAGAVTASRGEGDTTPDPGAGPQLAIPRGRLWFAAGAALIAALAEGAVGDWAGIHLHETLGSSESLAASAFVGFSLMMAGVRFVGDPITTRFGTRRVVGVAGALAATGFAVAVASGSVAVALVGYGLVGVGLATVIPLAFAAAGQEPGVHPGQGIAAVATVAYTGFMLGPPLIGFVAEATSLRLALAMLAVALGSLPFMARRLPGRDARPDPATALP